jgi:hypothetical protein
MSPQMPEKHLSRPARIAQHDASGAATSFPAVHRIATRNFASEMLFHTC